MKRLLCAAVAAVLVCGMTGCGGKDTSSTEPIKIGAVFAVTGNAAKLGGPEKNTALMEVEKINAAGGINGRLIELIIEDDQSVPENAVIAVQKLITGDNVLAIIGPTTSGCAMAIGSACEEAKVPLVSCAAAWVQLFPGKDTTQPMFKYVFKTPQNDSDAARAIFDDCRTRGLTQVAIVTAADGFGDAGRKELVSNAPNYGVTIVADETYPPDATDLTPILTSIKAKKPQAVINWSIVDAQKLIAGQMKQVGLTAQLYQSHGFGNKAYITPEAEGLLFPAGRLLVVDDIDASNPQYTVLSTFKKEYETMHGEQVSTFAGHAYDALHMVVAVIQSGGADRESIRNGLEATTNFVGTAGIFKMSPTDHCGLGADAFAMLTVKDGQFRLAEAVKPVQ